MDQADRTFTGTELSLRDYASILLRHKWLAAGVLFGVLLTAAAWTAVTPSRYESTAAVVLRTNNNQQLFPSVGASQRSQFLRQPEAELEYVESSFFSSQAGEVAPPATAVRARYDNGERGRSSEIEFIGSSSSPEDAQASAQAWAELYLDLRASNDIGEVEATIQSTEALIAELEIEKDELLAPIKPIDDALLQETDSDTISRLTTQRLSLRQSLEDDLLPVTIQLRTLSQDLSSLRIASGYVSRADNSARISVEAPLGRKVAPQEMRNMALATVLGLMLAAGATLLKESFLGVINGPTDLASIAPDIPILAQIPEFGKRTADPLDLADDPGTPYAQAFERVVSSLLYERLHHTDRRMSVLVTSSVSGEGKTTVASHLALRLNSTPTSTILLDADLRRPDVHATFGEKQTSRGLSHLLKDREPLEPHLRPLIRAPRVRALFAGAGTDDAAALLRRAFPPAIESLNANYDVLVVDAPPVLAVTDAEVMAHSLDSVIVAVRDGKTKRGQLAETLRKLATVDAKIIGFVLVAVKARGGGYGYSYSYGYASDGSSGQLGYSADAFDDRTKQVEAETPAMATASVAQPQQQSQQAPQTPEQQAPAAKQATRTPSKPAVKPAAVISPQAKASQTKASKAKASQVKASKAKASKASKAKPPQAEPSNAKPPQAEPSNAKAPEAKAPQDEPSNAKPPEADVPRVGTAERLRANAERTRLERAEQAEVKNAEENRAKLERARLELARAEEERVARKEREAAGDINTAPGPAAAPSPLWLEGSLEDDETVGMSDSDWADPLSVDRPSID